MGPTEQARLLVFLSAELARRQRAKGLRLNAPEAIAIATDEMHMAARAGATFDEVVAAGMRAIEPDDLLGGVAALISEIRVEVLLKEGTRLILLRDLAGPRTIDPSDEPGAIIVGSGAVTINDGMHALELEVTNDSDHTVRVSSHFPFDRVNPRLTFDRDAARGARLDIAAGDTVRWAPGERKTVSLVRSPETQDGA